MKDLDKIIIFINSKKNLIENILYKYSLLKKYSDNFYKDLTIKFLNKINSKNDDVGDFALKLKKKLILDKEEERLINIIIKYFKYDYLKKKMELKKKIIKKKKDSEPSISISDSDRYDSSEINSKISDNITAEIESISASSINSLTSFYSSENTSSSIINEVKINKSKNKNIFITKNDLINDFGKKVKHIKKISPKNITPKNKKEKKSKDKNNKENINMNTNNNINTNSNHNINHDENFGIKIKNKGIIRI